MPISEVTSFVEMQNDNSDQMCACQNCMVVREYKRPARVALWRVAIFSPWIFETRKPIFTKLVNLEIPPTYLPKAKFNSDPSARVVPAKIYFSLYCLVSSSRLAVELWWTHRRQNWSVGMFSPRTCLLGLEYFADVEEENG